MIVWPGLRRSVSAISRLFNSASFYAPLTHSAIPERAATGTTATFTRATTKTVENNDGYLVTLLAGEIGFPGARRVHNILMQDSEDISGWTLIGTASRLGNVLSMPADGDGIFVDGPTYGSVLTGLTFVMQVEMSGSGTVAIRLDGNAGGNGSAYVSVTLSATPTWFDLSHAFPTTVATYPQLLVRRNGTTATSVTIHRAQLEDVTAQTTQTAGEYVSVGVYDNFGTTNLLSVADVADFNSAGWVRSGLTASGNTVTFGANTDSLRCNATGPTSGTYPPIAGNTYVLQFTVSATAAINTVKFEIVDVTDGVPTFDQNINVTTTPTTYTIVCAMTSAMSVAGPTFWVNRTASMTGAVGQTMTITGLRYVDVSYFHGSFVDGVKCYATDLAGNALTTMRRYNAEGARENLCLQSNAFTTTWVAVGTPGATQNVIGPDGATSAWTLTDNDAGTSEGIAQVGFTLTAATYTGSLFVEKTTGAQTGYPVIFIQDAVAGRAAICTVDTTNGVATVWTAYTGYIIQTSVARCTSYNDDFWRVELAFTATATADWRYYIYPAGALTATKSSGTLDANATGSAVFYGAQVELGSFASSYIATTTTAVTRNADVLTYSSAGNVSDTAGWCYAEASTKESTSAQSAIVSASIGVGLLEMLSDATTISTDDGAVGVTKTGLSSMLTAPRKRVSSWGAAGQLVTGDGAAPASGAYDGSHGVSAIGIGSGTTGGIPWFGNIGPIYIGQRQLSASEMQAITAA